MFIILKLRTCFDKHKQSEQNDTVHTKKLATSHVLMLKHLAWINSTILLLFTAIVLKNLAFSTLENNFIYFTTSFNNTPNINGFIFSIQPIKIILASSHALRACNEVFFFLAKKKKNSFLYFINIIFILKI